MKIRLSIREKSIFEHLQKVLQKLKEQKSPHWNVYNVEIDGDKIRQDLITDRHGKQTRWFDFAGKFLEQSPQRPRVQSSIKLSSKEQEFMSADVAPNFEPLEKIFKEPNEKNNLKLFNFMGAVKMINNNIIYIYKNTKNNKTINIDSTGNTYEMLENTYKILDNYLAKIRVLAG